MQDPAPVTWLKSALLASWVHGFTLRQGGVSQGGYASLNLGAHVGDAAEALHHNWAALRRAAAWGASPCALLDQVHGAQAVHARDLPPGDPTTHAGRVAADALCLQTGELGGVLTADCVPILLGDRATGRAAAIHAGWRGLVAGVVEATFAALQPRDPVVAFGPHIGVQAFEVGPEVARALVAVSCPAVSRPGSGDRAWLSLAQVLRYKLAALGVGAAQIEQVGGCTYAEAGRYFSFRRDGAGSGRQLAFIRAR